MQLLSLCLLAACAKDAAPPLDTHQPPTPDGVPTLSFIDAAAASGLTPCAGLYAVAAGDFDRDAAVDIALSCGQTEPLRLFQNLGGLFSEISASLGQSGDPEFNDRRVPAFGDMDGDGDLGLFVPTGGANGLGQGLDQLFRNNGAGWEDMAAALNIQDPVGGGRYAIWFDHDGDSDDDLFVGHRVYAEVSGRDHHVLWESGPWTDVAEASGLTTTAFSTGAGLAADWDADGDTDLLLSERCVGDADDCADDPDSESCFFRNSGGLFASVSCAALGEVVSAVSGDVDNDGDIDLVLGRVDQPAAILLNPGDGTAPCAWTRTALPELTRDATALALADFDNDGALDLFVGAPNADGASPPTWFQGDGAGEFTALGTSGPELWAQSGRVFAAPIDLDADGWMDLLVGAEGVAEGPTLQVLRNELGDAGSPNRAYSFWLIDSRGGGSTVGARVSAAGRVVTKMAGGSWRTSVRDALHIGAGELESSAVEVTWADGTTQRHEALPPGCYVLSAADATATPC